MASIVPARRDLKHERQSLTGLTRGALMKSGVAWGLAVFLTMVVLGGIGAMLAHGVTLGDTSIRLRLTGHWTTSRGLHTIATGRYVSGDSHTRNFGFFAVDTNRVIRHPGGLW
jgi:hypothetical protein